MAPIGLIGNIGTPEIIVILVVALLVLGPNKLPEVARQVGKAVRDFQGAARGLAGDLRREVADADQGVRKAAAHARAAARDAVAEAGIRDAAADVASAARSAAGVAQLSDPAGAPSEAPARDTTTAGPGTAGPGTAGPGTAGPGNTDGTGTSNGA